jgi:aryl-alcohol dehydrogenase-like predicted oxidoreductase
MLKRSSTQKWTCDLSSHAFLLKTLQQICRLLVFSDGFLRRRNATPAQISLAWLLAQKAFIVPIPGTRRADHLHDNLRAIDVQLTPADLREIETALSNIEVHGGR